MNKARSGVLPRTLIGIRMLPGSPLPRPSIHEPVESGSAHGVKREDFDRGEPLPLVNKPGRDWIFVRYADSEEEE